MQELVIQEQSQLLVPYEQPITKITIKKQIETKLILSHVLQEEILVEIEESGHVQLCLIMESKKSNIRVQLQKDANATIDLFLLQADCNIDMIVDLVGSGAEITTNVLSIARHATKRVAYRVNHLAPVTLSHVNNDCIALEKGINEFITEGFIAERKSGSNVRQMTRGIMLDDTGKIIAKPILLISEYDVKAYHGASVGKINEDDLFYLMSRGLTLKEAYQLVIQGIINPYLERLFDKNTQTIVLNQYQDFFKE